MLLTSLFKHWSYRLFAPGVMLRRNYESFKELLVQDGRCHDLMAELELLYHEGRRLDQAGIRRLYAEFSAAVGAMIDHFAPLHPTSAATLRDYYKKIDFYTRFLLAPAEQHPVRPYVLALDEIDDPALSGNKAYNLARLKKELRAPVADGFVFTTNAFYRLLLANDLRPRIDHLLAAVDIEDGEGLRAISAQLIELIRGADIPLDIAEESLDAYERLQKKVGTRLPVAVRSSAVSEDGEHSFAGQYHSELGVEREELLASWLAVLASKYSPEALIYRITVGLADEDAAMAVLVLPMVDAAVSGVLYTALPDDPRQQRMAVYAVAGLGEALVGGRVRGDVITLDRERGSVVERLAGERGAAPLSAQTLRELHQWGAAIERLYGAVQDIEWAVRASGELSLLQARPLHASRRDAAQEQHLFAGRRLLLSGALKAAGGVAGGPLFFWGEGEEKAMPQDAVLVVRTTPPSLARLLHRVSAVIAEEGSAAGHFATVCREFGIPLLIGATQARELLQPGEMVSVDADRGAVYAGAAPHQERRVQPSAGQLPYFRKLRPVLDFITPLHLLDPEGAGFKPEGCRSLHDIIRYTHERAVRTMFSLGEQGGGRGTRTLRTDLPLMVRLLDVGGAIREGVGEKEMVGCEDILSTPFLALWDGLSQPGIDWQSHSHFDWKSFDEVTMAGGIVGKGSGDFASYAIVGRDYLNLNMRFGYHFTLVDVLCGDEARTNYCQLRFAGGGGEFVGRALRLEFLLEVLRRLGFEVTVKADLLDARLSEMSAEALGKVLDQLGRLLGATKLMDMVLKDHDDVERCVSLFFQGCYSFVPRMTPDGSAAAAS